MDTYGTAKTVPLPESALRCEKRLARFIASNVSKNDFGSNGEFV